MKIILRDYQSEDFEELYQIDQTCYSKDVAYSRSDLRAYLGFPTSECVVAEAGGTDATARKWAKSGRQGKVIGFCVGAYRGAEGYIITMDVLASYRRQGVGTLLLEEIERRLAAMGVREVGLETAKDDEGAVAFWHRHGYRTRAVRKGYYPRGRDAYSMSKMIGGVDVITDASERGTE